MVQKSCTKSARFPGLAIAIIMIAAGAFSIIQTASAQSPSHKVIAYYFHTNTRCDTCIKIEAYSHEAIEEGFKSAIKDGTLELRVVNYEEPQNRHYIKDYKLVSKSLILVNLVEGKQTEWTNLKLVWTLVKSKEAFLNYVRGEVKDYLSKS
jgi:hypothetical protein